jgi:hypothetical protein
MMEGSSMGYQIINGRRKGVIIFALTLLLLMLTSCEDKSTDAVNFNAEGTWFGVLHGGNGGANFEYFNIYGTGFSAKGEMTFYQGFEQHTEIIMISGDWEEEGSGYGLSGTFSLRILDGDGYQVYSSNGNVSGELHYDNDMPFPEGTGSGSTNDGQYSISWSIFKTS